jgi:acetate kinase
MLALVLNAGSSSLKFQIIDTDSRECRFKGQVERIGIDGLTHSDAVMQMNLQIANAKIELGEIEVVGHRVVHGGNLFKQSTLLDAEVVESIEKLIPLAPLHNPAHLIVIKELMEQLPDVPHVAVFDTAFHSTMPEAAFTYALDQEVAEKFEIRRYGFHGSSHKYVMNESAKFLDKEVSDTSLIICHIGNGASITAIRDGKSVDTSMGMTPLEGLVMGTRTGDIDAGILFHLAREANYSITQLDQLVNKESGLLGLAGSADMRQVRESADAGNKGAQLAREIYAYRIRKYIGAYMTLLPHLDAVVFTAGVGENDAQLRDAVIAPLKHLGLLLDANRNSASADQAREVSAAETRIKVLVVPTNEELEIALESVQLIGG